MKRGKEGRGQFYTFENLHTDFRSVSFLFLVIRMAKVQNKAMMVFPPFKFKGRGKKTFKTKIELKKVVGAGLIRTRWLVEGFSIAISGPLDFLNVFEDHIVQRHILVP